MLNPDHRPDDRTGDEPLDIDATMRRVDADASFTPAALAAARRELDAIAETIYPGEAIAPHDAGLTPAERRLQDALTAGATLRTAAFQLEREANRRPASTQGDQ